MAHEDVNCIFCDKNFEFKSKKDLQEHFIKDHWAYRNKDFLLTSCHMTLQERQSVMSVIMNKTSDATEPIIEAAPEIKEQVKKEPVDSLGKSRKDNLSDNKGAAVNKSFKAIEP